jgi:serine/threonine-protein kinase RsbT
MQERIPLRNDLDFHTAALRSRQFALNAGLDLLASQRLATAISELTRNVQKYAGGDGWVTLRLLAKGAEHLLEAQVVDHGPGIDDLDKAMQDHYSTSGTLGLGLPGVKRLVDQFTIETKQGQGTCITLRMRGSRWRHG